MNPLVTLPLVLALLGNNIPTTTIDMGGLNFDVGFTVTTAEAYKILCTDPYGLVDITILASDGKPVSGGILQPGSYVLETRDDDYWGVPYQVTLQLGNPVERQMVLLSAPEPAAGFVGVVVCLLFFCLRKKGKPNE